MTEIKLREEMEIILKHELRILAIKTRDRLNLTQSRMAERYVMSENSYSSLETGEYMCGTLTTVLLLQEQENPAKFLLELRIKFDKFKEGELQSL